MEKSLKACFIGWHYGLPEEMVSGLKKELDYLITCRKVTTFYCGEYGKFDRQVIKVLNELKKYFNQIKIIKIKPYYQTNKFLSRSDKKEYELLLKNLKRDYYPEEPMDNFKYKKFLGYYNLRKEELKQQYMCASWYLSEKENFDDVVLLDLDSIPYKARIIEANKWKVRECDYLVAFCVDKYSNSWKIREYAKKLNKKIIDL